MERGQYKTRIRREKRLQNWSICVYIIKLSFFIGKKRRIKLFTPWSPLTIFDNLTARKIFVLATEEVTTGVEKSHKINRNISSHLLADVPIISSLQVSNLIFSTSHHPSFQLPLISADLFTTTTRREDTRIS